MGNYCFGRLEETETTADQSRRNVEISNPPTRLRPPSHNPRNIIHEYYLPQIHEHDPIYHPAPGISRPMSQLTEEEQILIATRMGLLGTLPMFIFDESKKEKFTECIICMCEYIEGEECRHLPCLHTFHRKCIDDWLIRSFTCPSCLEQVDAVLLSSQNNGKSAESIGKQRKKRRSIDTSSINNTSAATQVNVAGTPGDNSTVPKSHHHHHHHRHHHRSASQHSHNRHHHNQAQQQQQQHQQHRRVNSSHQYSYSRNTTDNTTSVNNSITSATGDNDAGGGNGDGNEEGADINNSDAMTASMSSSFIHNNSSNNNQTGTTINHDDSTSATALLQDQTSD